MAPCFVRKVPFVALTLVLLLGTAGCVKRDGRNSDCKWPAETVHHSPNARHLSADAEFAEDLAIRYADSHFGRRSPNPSEQYGAERDRCMEALFERVAEEHAVPVEQVSDSLGRNRVSIDLAEILSFATLYVFVAVVVARMSWRRYSPEDHGWTPGMIMALFLSMAFAGAGLLLGDVWCDIAETYRIGNSHMSYRFERLLWARHRVEFFVGLLVVFWLAATANARNMRSQLSSEA
jgi:hypothetical protein